MGENSGRDIELLTITQIMSTKDGRSFMWRCLQNTNLYGNVFDKDTHQHAYNSGLRSHGLWLMGEIQEAVPGSYLTMIRENTNE